MNDVSEQSHEVTRRKLLGRNIKAIAAVAAGALVTRLTPAHAVPRPVCFMRGTRIQTVAGERRIEDLVAGDMLPTVFGGMRPIQWIVRFRRQRAETGRAWPVHARPIRIMKSALAHRVPHADLFVTPGHALLIDGVLVTAGSLVNGTTIAPYAAEEYDELEFFQVKLGTHDAIYAEGAPCETLLKVDESAADYAEYLDSCGPSWSEEAHCAPIYGNGAQSELSWRLHSAVSRWIGPHKVDTIRERLEGRVAEALARAS